MALWIWQSIRLDLPDDWEMLQFNRQAESGRCAFADRYQVRLELNWRKIQGIPDVERMVSDSTSRYRNDRGMKDARQERVGRWLGMEGTLSGVLTSRYTRFLRDRSCLVQLIFVWPGKRDTQLIQETLSHVREEPEWRGALQHWRAFGMGMLATRELPLQSCKVEAAHADMLFSEYDSTKHTERYRRLGMVKEWLQRSVGDWLAAQAPKGTEILQRQSTQIALHQIHHVVGRKPGAMLKKLTGKYSRWEASAWICPHDGRLYSMAVSSDPPLPELKRMAGRRLSCCKNMELRK